MQARKLYLDTSSRAFVAEPTSTLPASGLAVFEEDVEDIQLYFLEPTGDFSTPYRYLNYSTLTATFALGSGSVAATVTSFSAISTSVTITASVSITGGSGITEVQRVQISPAPATGYYSLQLPTRNVTVSSVAASIFTAPYHAILDGQSVTLTGFSTPSGFSNGSVYFVRDRTRDGFKIASTAGGTAITASVASGGGTAVVPTYTTAPLAAGTTPIEISAALASAAGSGTQEIAAVGTASDYLLTYGGTYAGAALPTVAITASTLAGAPGLAGRLNLDTVEIAALAAAGTSEVTMEVQVSNGTLRNTFQGTATLGDDLINATGTPSSVAGTSFTLKSPDASVWAVSIDDSGIMTATKQ
jgi:hypothetical protein